MAIDRASFLVLAGAIASSNLACQREPYGRAPAPEPAPAPPTPSASLAAALKAGPIVVDVVEPATTTGALVCDDTQGTAGDCPSIGPADEGVCPDVIAKRCAEFKVAMKPRVAAQAVECLRTLKGNERCDAARINQCGHAALMSACAEPSRPRKGQLTAASGTEPVSVALVADSAPAAAPSPVHAACQTIQKACGERPLAPTLADCRQTLSGMSEIGRANMVECVSARCLTGGLYACEAVPKAAANATAVR